MRWALALLFLPWSACERRPKADVALLEEIALELSHASDHCRARLSAVEDALLLEDHHRAECVDELASCERERQECCNASLSCVLPPPLAPASCEAALGDAPPPRASLEDAPPHAPPGPSPLESALLATVVNIGCAISPKEVLPNKCSPAPGPSSPLQAPSQINLQLLVGAARRHQRQAKEQETSLRECRARHPEPPRAAAKAAPPPSSNSPCLYLSRWVTAESALLLLGAAICAALGNRCVSLGQQLTERTSLLRAEQAKGRAAREAANTAKRNARASEALHQRALEAVAELKQETQKLRLVKEENKTLRDRLAELEQKAATPPGDLQDFEAALQLLASLPADQPGPPATASTAPSLCSTGGPGPVEDPGLGSEEAVTPCAWESSPPAPPPHPDHAPPPTADTEEAEGAPAPEGAAGPPAHTPAWPPPTAPVVVVPSDQSLGPSTASSSTTTGEEHLVPETPSPAHPVIAPVYRRHWCNIASLGVAFQLPSIDCRWRSSPAAEGQILCVRRFTPEDRHLAERLTLLVIAEQVPWDMSLAAYRDICILQLQDILHGTVAAIDEGHCLVQGVPCVTLQYVQRHAGALHSHTAMLLRPCIAVSWQVVWRARNVNLAAGAQHYVTRLLNQLLDSVVLYHPGAAQEPSPSEDPA